MRLLSMVMMSGTLFQADKGAHNYSIEGRRANAERLVRLSKYIEKARV